MSITEYKTKLEIELSVFEDFFDPKDFSNHIGMQPTSFWYKGDLIPPTKGLKSMPNAPVKTRKESCWYYSTGYVETRFFEELSEPFVENFKSKIEKIKEYKSNKKVDIKIYIIAEININNDPVFSFSKNFLNLIHELDIDIDMDIYYLCNKCANRRDRYLSRIRTK